MPLLIRTFASTLVAPRTLARDALPLAVVVGVVVGVVAGLWLLAGLPAGAAPTQGIEMAPFRWGPGPNQGIG